MKCFKCGREDGTIIKHHIKYNPEIIVDCCRSCHKIIHNKVRKEDTCPYSVEDVKKMSQRMSYKRNIKHIYFHTTISPNILLSEDLKYNVVTGNVRYISWFAYNGKQHIPEVNIL